MARQFSKATMDAARAQVLEEFNLTDADLEKQKAKVLAAQSRASVSAVFTHEFLDEFLAVVGGIQASNKEGSTWRGASADRVPATLSDGTPVSIKLLISVK